MQYQRSLGLEVPTMGQGDDSQLIESAFLGQFKNSFGDGN